MDTERNKLWEKVFYSFHTFQRRLLWLNFSKHSQSTKLGNNSNLFLKVNKKFMICFLFSTQDYFNNRPRSANVQSYVLCADFRAQTHSGRKHCNFPWRLSLCCPRSGLSEGQSLFSPTDCVAWEGDLPTLNFPSPSHSHPALEWSKQGCSDYLELCFCLCS